MAAKDRMAVLSAMMEQSVIPVFYHPDFEVCRNVIQACANAGAKCVEFTNRGDFAAQVFYELSRYFASADPSVIMGVGSIVDAPTAGIYIANGAKFVVSPLTSVETAKLCNRRGIPYSPGCGSATEIGDAQELGCEIIKVFPGSSVGGPEFVKSVMGPMPWTRNHAHRRCGANRRITAQVVWRRHRRLRHRLEHDHQETARCPGLQGD